MVETPYRSSHRVDSIPLDTTQQAYQKLLTYQIQTIVGSLLWLSGATQPDLTTITSM